MELREPTRAHCPAPDRLDAFAQGTLAAADVEAIERHIDGCSDCGRLVAELAWAYGASNVDTRGGAGPQPGDTQPAMAVGLPAGHGRTLGRYLVLERLGEGGMGIVFAAYDPDLDRKVAVKLLHGAAGDEERQRLLREAQAMARLAHPNVVAVHDVCPVGERLFLAMEFVDGQTFGAWMRERKRSWREVVGVLLACAHGLHAAHQAGIVHRDFKPDNVLIGRDGRVRVSDFGLARPSGHAPPVWSEGSGPALAQPMLTRAGALVGTPAYMSPEQFTGRGADARSDQFSFCVTAYEALWGTRPFAGRSILELADAVVHGRMREPPKTGVPRWLRQLVLRGLAVDPAARYAGMADIVRVLESRRHAGRRWIAAATFVGGTALGVAGLHWATAGAGLPCDDDDEALAGAWSEQRKLSLVEGLAAVPSTFAKGTADRVGTALDEYAARWVDMRREACQATHVRHEQSDQLFDRRMACLERRRARLHALVDVLLANRDASLEHAITAVGSLPPLSDCSDLDRLQADVAPPDDPQVRATIETLRLELDAIAALDATGQTREGLERAQELDARVQTLAYPPLAAEVALQLGRLYGDAGAYEPAAFHLERAHLLARGSGHDRVAAQAIVALVDAVGYDLLRLEDGRRWAKLAEADVERSADPVLRAALWGNRADLEGAGGHPRTALELDRLAFALLSGVGAEDPITIAAGLRRIGNDHFTLGEYGLALDYGQRGLAMAEPLLGSDHPALSMWLRAVANAQYMLGDDDAARVAYERALALLESAHGREHPDVARVLGNLALTVDEKDPTRALELHREALGIFERTLGPNHPDLTGTLNNLGKAFEDRGQYPEAVPFFERSLAIAEARLGPQHPDVADALNALGRVRQQLGDSASALELHRRVLEIRRTHLGDRHPQVGVALHNVAQDLDGLGRAEEARLHFQQALVVLETALGPDHSGVGTVCTNFGNHLQRQGQPEAAREQHERALRIHRKLAGETDKRTAGAHHNLGRALADLGRCDEARTHLDAALAAFVALKDPGGAAQAREALSDLDACRASGTAPAAADPAPP